MSEENKRNHILAAWALITTLIIVSCQAGVKTTAPLPTLAGTELNPIPATVTPEEITSNSLDHRNPVLEPVLSAADCMAAGVPEIACTGVTANDQWNPVFREFSGIPMALVPAGCYTMGSSPEQIEHYLAMKDLPAFYQDEQPAHLQCFQEPFWIDVYEVTNGFYGSYGVWQGNNQPRESVTWFEANAYCKTRGSHLPSEVEWEYAARGPDNLIYPWGNTFDGNRLNYCDVNCPNPGADTSHNDGYAISAPVGSFPSGASWVGAEDMAGNVWEWVSSSLQAYPYNPDDGREAHPEELTSTSTMGLRGGGRLDPDYVVRSPQRNERKAHYYDSRFGLRCARFFDPANDGNNPPQDMPQMVMEPPKDPGIGDTWIRPYDGAIMVFVPGGTFLMGLDPDQSSSGDMNEYPQHPAQIDPYWIDRHLITTKQFAEFLFIHGNQVENNVTWFDTESEYNLFENRGDFLKPYLGFEDHPVTGVSWYGAQAYCDWVGGRLLTEAEWEYAASGSENLIYPWGNDFDCTKGNFSDWTDEEEPPSSGESGCDGFDFTSPVDAFPKGASWIGVLDLAGNAGDWVSDWGISHYPAVLQTNPAGPESGTMKIVRGGSWEDYSWDIRTTARGEYYPTMRSPTIGFRCAYPVEP